jgi:serine/threonine-protein kinase HipA
VVIDRDGAAGLLIRRFDRITAEGQLRALAVEDGCQAADRPPADKYRLSTEQVFTALGVVCDAPLLARRQLIRQLAFAYLTGNGDAHAKNFSIRQDLSNEWQVSPAYDVPSSDPYGDTTMALSIAGRGGSDFGAKDFVALGQRLAVPERAVRRSLTELAERTDRWLGDLDRLPFDRGQITKLRRVINHRRQRLIQN